MKNNTTIVAVGGTNSLKVGGTSAAFKRLPEATTDYVVRGTKAGSIVNEQPIGMVETKRGAAYRAEAAFVADKDAAVGVGVENGLIPEGGSVLDRLLFTLLLASRWFPARFGWGRAWLRKWLGRFSFYDLAFVCIVDRTSRTFSMSAAVPCPQWAAIESIMTRQQRTAGSILAEKTGWDGANWHKTLTGGLSDRGSILYEAIFLAVALHLTGCSSEVRYGEWFPWLKDAQW